MTALVIKANLESSMSHALARVAGALQGLARGLKRWHLRNRALGELARLDAHSLADIGLDRTDLHDIVEALHQAREHRAPPLPLV